MLYYYIPMDYPSLIFNLEINVALFAWSGYHRDLVSKVQSSPPNKLPLFCFNVAQEHLLEVKLVSACLAGRPFVE